MILKQDEPLELVKRSINSVKQQVDGIYVTVTYTKDIPKTTNPLMKYLEKIGAKVTTFQWVYDFAVARNFAMAQVPHGSDIYIYWQDADDVLQGAGKLREVMETAHKQNIAAVFFNYLYNVELDENGDIKEVLVQHKRERVIRNDHTFKWIGSLHETLIEQRTENVIKISIKDCQVVHLSTQDRADKNIERNIHILEEQAKRENHKDPRTLIYLAKAYFDMGKMATTPEDRKIWFNLAIALFHEYLEGFGKPGDPGYSEGSGWPEERATAWTHVGEIALLSGDAQIAVQAFQQAIDESPEFPNHYIDLAMGYLHAGDIKKAKHWLKVATSIDMPETSLIITPRDMKYRALEVDFQISVREGKYAQAKADAEEMYKLFPEREDFKNRIQMMGQADMDNKASQSIVFLGKYLEKTKGNEERLEHLVKAIPESLQQERFVSEMKHRFLPMKIWGDNEIAILCGPGFETWSPDSVKTGLGGSEEAVVYLSKELAKLGWKVTVYANPGARAGDFDGVTYKTWHELNPKDSFNVLILWRSIGFVDLKPRAKFTMVWMHDIPNNPDFTEERVNMVNKIAVLSEFHRGQLRLNKGGEFIEMPLRKTFLTANGIVPMEIDKTIVRDPKRMIYSSSPDRGLVYLLKMWPDIIKEVPEAKLDVYYGFDIFDVLHAGNPGSAKWKAHVLDMMKQPGITYHGRVGHEELQKAMMGAGIWAYPTDFTEISCITAMKTQALGAIPVVTNFAALKETVKNGLKIDMDITTEEGQKEYKEQLIRLISNPEEQDVIRKDMMKWAQEYFTWDKVAFEWDRLFRINLQNPDINFSKEVLNAK